MSENPYEPPAGGAVDLPPGPHVSWGRRLARVLGQTVVFVAFVAGVAETLSLLIEGQRGWAALSAVALGVVTPLFLEGTWRERLLACLWVPVCVLLGVGGVAFYFRLFRFSWFEAVFNNKGSWPLGLLLFFLGFAVGLPVLGIWLFERMRRR